MHPSRHPAILLQSAEKVLAAEMGKDAAPSGRVLLPIDAGTKNVRTFAYGALFNDMGEEMGRPYLPTYAAILGADPVLFAIIISIEELVNRVVRPLGGVVSDRVGRKPPVIGGYMAICAYRLGLSLSQAWYYLIPFVSIRQVGRGFRDAAREASVAESVPPEIRGRQFGLILTVDTVGAALGPILGLILLSLITYGSVNFNGEYASPEPFRILFLVAALPTFVSATIVALRLRETRRPTPEAQQRSYGDAFRQGFRLYVGNRPLLVYTVANCIFAAGALPIVMVVAYVQLVHLGGATLFDIMYLSVIYAIVHATASYPAGMIVDKFGRRTAQVLGDMLAVATFAAFAFAPTPAAAIPGFILYGLFEALWVVSRRSVIADLAPEGYRAQALGMFSMLYGMAGFVSPVLFTILWVFVSPQAGFIALAAIVLVAALILIAAAPPQVTGRSPGVGRRARA